MTPLAGVFLRAAMAVDESILGGCSGIERSCEDDLLVCIALTGFHYALEPDDLVLKDWFWWGAPRSATEEEKNARVIGLLLMHELAKDAAL